MISNIFIIDKKNNTCVFYGEVEEQSEDENLEDTLASIIEYASVQPVGAIKTIRLSSGRYMYGVFDKIYVITKTGKGADTSKIKEFIKGIAQKFIEKYGERLTSYEDAEVFDGFTSDLGDYLRRIVTESEEKESTEVKPPIKPPEKKEEPAEKQSEESEKEELKEKSKSGLELLKTPEPIKYKPQELPEEELEIRGDRPIIQPEKRDAYPNGIEDYMRDEVLWNESQRVMQEYTSEFVDNVISKLKIYMPISIVHNYEIIIDFTEYPNKPKIILPDFLQEDIGKPYEEISYFLKNWDPRMPPHIIEIVREMEKILLRLKSLGKLLPTNEMPEPTVPDMEPLEIPPMPPVDNGSKNGKPAESEEKNKSEQEQNIKEKQKQINEENKSNDK